MQPLADLAAKKPEGEADGQGQEKACREDAPAHITDCVSSSGYCDLREIPVQCFRESKPDDQVGYSADADDHAERTVFIRAKSPNDRYQEESARPNLDNAQELAPKEGSANPCCHTYGVRTMFGLPVWFTQMGLGAVNVIRFSFRGYDPAILTHPVIHAFSAGSRAIDPAASASPATIQKFIAVGGSMMTPSIAN